MPKGKVASSSGSSRKMRPALSPEARENQMISLAMDLAEKQLMEGTASSSVIVHFLKLGTKKEVLEREILEKQKTLIDAKAANLAKDNENEQLTRAAIDAIKGYRGSE